MPRSAPETMRLTPTLRHSSVAIGLEGSNIMKKLLFAAVAIFALTNPIGTASAQITQVPNKVATVVYHWINAVCGCIYETKTASQTK